MTINVLNEFLPPAEDIRRGAIKVGETLDIDDNNVLNVDSSAVLGSYYSNCITEIPQDIKLELNNGILTLKGGCKVYVPDGIDNFEEAYSILDVTTTETTTGIYFILYHPDDGYLTQVLTSNCYVSDSEPAEITTNDFWYDTTENKIKRKTNDDYEDRYSLPLGIVTVIDGSISNIEQVFNGAGYIGHHAFILPGVKGLIADGKTEQGTVKSILKEVETVYTLDLSSGGVHTYNNAYITLNTSTNLGRVWYKSWTEASELQQLEGYIQYAYDTNTTYRWNTSTSTYNTILELPFVDTSMKDDVVTYFNILQPLRIAATNDKIDTTGTFLFDYKWTDHIPNKLSWIDSSLFSWVDGNVYKGAYEELLTAWNGSYTQKTDNGVTYRDTVKGYQIAGPDQEANIIDAWNRLHTAWFYILDIENKRFKLPRLASKEIVETYQNGSTWYRIYADNWIEQGSQIAITGSGWQSARTFTLPISMLNTNYLVFWMSGYNGYIDHDTVVTARTTTTFTISQYTGYQANANWRVEGFSSIQYETSNNQSVVRPFKHLYFYLGYTDLDVVNEKEIDLDLVTSQKIQQIDTETEEGIHRIITASNALNQTQVTNCITEIPQDIKVELNDGILTLKAGSKVYVPNGFKEDGTTPRFDTFIIPNDLTYPIAHVTVDKRFVFVNRSELNELKGWRYDHIYSGTTDPNAGSIWYDTANNLMKHRPTTSDPWEIVDLSLPICNGNYTNNFGFNSIDNVFNGFGYLGGSIFALPGIKGLYPNGRNADGMLNNLEYTFEQVSVRTLGSTANHTYLYGLELGDGIGIAEDQVIADECRIYSESNIQPTTSSHYKWFNTATNLQYWHDPNSELFAGLYHIKNIKAGYFTATDGKITNFIPATPVRLPNANCMDYVIAYKMPTASSLTWYRKYASGWVEQGGIFDYGSFIQDNVGKDVTLLIPMTAKNYYISGNSIRYDRDGESNGLSSVIVSFFKLSTTGFKIRWWVPSSNETVRYATWEVKGFAAV